MKNTDTRLHVRGESLFIDDLAEHADLLQAYVFTSPVAHAKITKFDVAKAREFPGVHAVLTADDVPGENQIGGIIPDEPLLGFGHIHFAGEPLALILAKDRARARAAAKSIVLEYEELPAITDPREAYAQNKLIAPPRCFEIGNVDCVWDKCDHIFEGVAESGGQEHFYMETQIAMAVPKEQGDVRIYSSTQSPTVVQKAASRVLGVGLHKVEVDVRRMGGAFGGKEDQATAWAVLAALGAMHTGRPVKLKLWRNQDIAITGKRHPYSSDYKIGLDGEGRIIAYECTYYQNAGAVADLSTSILERTLFHATNSYFVPNVRVTAISCRTNLPPFTAFRGFGGPQGMFVMEAAIRKAALSMGLTPRAVQAKNLLQEKDEFCYGMRVEHSRAQRCWDETVERYKVEDVFGRIADFNDKNSRYKKGAALMPICFGISFTTIFLNQAGALVHVYQDGSVAVSTGATEMGQGVNMKIRKIVADVFGIEDMLVRVETTNTSRVANTSPTAASSGADMNGKAAQIAAQKILLRLKESAARQLTHNNPEDITLADGAVFCEGKKTEILWETLVANTYLSRVDLSAHGYFKVPGLSFDKTPGIEKGTPFAYHVFGTALTEVTVDCLKGTYTVDAVRVVHDIGRSIDTLIDEGQVFGALIQGIGWMTMEKLAWSEKGQPLVDTASKYKIPDFKSTPPDLELHFLKDADNPYAVANSKAVGEPPFMYGIGAYFAIMDALQASCPDKELPMQAPATPEFVLGCLYDLKK